MIKRPENPHTIAWKLHTNPKFIELEKEREKAFEEGVTAAWDLVKDAYSEGVEEGIRLGKMYKEGATDD